MDTRWYECGELVVDFMVIADQVITSGQNIFHNFLKWKVRVIDFALMQMQL